jgi:hypothetical protein
MAEIEVTEIEKDLDIDKNNLDVECIDQPRRFMRWSVEYAEAIRIRDEAKRKASVTKSNVNLDIRSRPSAYGIEKATEGSINAALESNEEVNTAEKAISDAQYAVNIFGAAKEALDQRRSMLERLVALYISGYYSQVKLGTEAVGKLSDEATAHQKSLLQARRKRE